MCGIAGLFDPSGQLAGDLRHHAGRMGAALAHRGPDDAGVWADEAAGVAFGFRRLAIVDLSADGHQPMPSASGRYVVAFNGEVYNHVELRRELEGKGHRFRGRSDTETMLAAFEAWGVEGAVRRFVGMFAFALWDARERVLHLGRDRLGIKPLFVFHGEGRVAFGSEMKALLAGPAFPRKVDRDALAAYLRLLYVPAPHGILRGVSKLPPGTVLSVRDPAAPLPEPRAFWSADEAALRGARDPIRAGDAEVVEETERTIAAAVSLRMRADVPLGAFLSGGIDSSVVVALMQRQSARPVRTFTVGFEAAAWNEAPYAAAVARHLGTEHTEVTLTGADALAAVPALPRLFDEPLADPSQIPTLLVSHLARRRVTVALSGDGGDEVFAGYNRYLHGAAVIGRAAAVPRPLRHLAAGALRAVSPAGWDRAFTRLAPVLPPSLRHRFPGDKLHKVAGLLAAPGAAEMYRSLVSQWPDPASLVTGAREPASAVERTLGGAGPLALMERMLLADQLGYLPDDLLAKVDRASMAVALEARVPLLDHRVVELAWRLPRRFRVRGGEGKWVLRRILERHLPRHLFERPKMGFSVPVDAWLRGPLRPWAEELLDERRLRDGGLLEPRPVRAAWRRFSEGRTRGGLGLWAVLVFLAWHEEWVEHAPVPSLAEVA